MKFASILLAASLAVSSSAYAGVLGSTVNSQYYAFKVAYNSGGSPATFTADNLSHAQFYDIFNITVSNNQIVYTFLKDTTFDYSDKSYDSNGLFIESGNLLTFVGAPALTNVTLDAASFTDPAMSYSFNSTQVAVNWNDVSFASGDKVILNLTTTPVPEPENMAMLLAGLGLIAVMRRRYS